MNSNTNSGLLEDLIRSMVQLSALELHAKTQCEKAEYNLQVVDQEELEDAIEVLGKAESNLLKVTEHRRTVMRLIIGFVPNADPTKWCEVKHISMAMITAFEAMQADQSHTGLADYFYGINRLFIETISDWLHLDIPPCASCFEDALKGVTA